MHIFTLEAITLIGTAIGVILAFTCRWPVQYIAGAGFLYGVLCFMFASESLVVSTVGMAFMLGMAVEMYRQTPYSPTCFRDWYSVMGALFFAGCMTLGIVLVSSLR